jgi:hypothetical protein
MSLLKETRETDRNTKNETGSEREREREEREYIYQLNMNEENK